MRALALAFVSICWALAPVVKRRVVDYMSLADEEESPVRCFVALHSVLTALVTVLMALPTPWHSFTRAIPAEGWTLLLFGAASSAASSIVLVGLLRDGNPGLVVVYANAATSILTYVAGALLYGELTLDGCAGVVFIAAGVSLTMT